MSQRQFAPIVGVGADALAKYETGQRAPSEETLNAILDRLNLTGEARDAILQAGRGIGASQWVATTLPERQAQLAAILRFEDRATRVFHNATDLVPGVLQTAGYVRAIMESHWGGLHPDEIEPRIATRIGRREILTRKTPAHFTAVLSEAALRQQVGDVQVQIDQLKFLLELSGLANVELRAYRFSSGWHPGLEAPFIWIESQDGEPIVHVATGRSGVFFHREEDIDYYRDTMHALVGDPAKSGEQKVVAMSPEATAELIADVIKELE